MYVDMTPEQKDLQAELRAYFAQLMTPEVRAAMSTAESGGDYKRLIRKMGSDGWLAIGWPKEYGGQGRPPSDQMIFFQEARLAGAPLPFVTLNTVGPALMALGSKEQQAKFLPGIAAGELHFSIGYSESGAGTDLAALITKAEPDGDEFVINGSKVFTSGAEGADYLWLAVRTDPEAKKHKGISMFIVDTKTPGISVAPIHCVGGVSTAVTYYEDVRVHKSMLVGELHGGWRLITAQLNHERIGLAAWGVMALGMFDRVLAWAKETPMGDGRRVIDQPWVQITMAEVFCRIQAMHVMNWRMAWELEQGHPRPAQASAVKVFGTESVIEAYRLMQDVMGAISTVRPGSPGAVLEGNLEREARGCQINTFGGGVNEIQRELVSMFGLSMPRVPR